MTVIRPLKDVGGSSTALFESALVHNVWFSVFIRDCQTLALEEMTNAEWNHERECLVRMTIVYECLRIHMKKLIPFRSEHRDPVRNHSQFQPSLAHDNPKPLSGLSLNQNTLHLPSVLPVTTNVMRGYLFHCRIQTLRNLFTYYPLSRQIPM